MIPPDTTRNVASRAGCLTVSESLVIQRRAAGPPTETLLAPPYGRSSSCATRQRGSLKRVAPTVSVTGPESAVRAAATRRRAAPP